ncbi:MAG TPA: Trm112 family protein [Proteobacteria bacterium]|nr:Trm112 family protein [Pseudomonadota bacterium]
MDKELLEILACPACKSSLKYDEENQKLICLDENRDSREFKRGEVCGLIYSIKDDIPIMLIEEAEVPSAVE